MMHIVTRVCTTDEFAQLPALHHVSALERHIYLANDPTHPMCKIHYFPKIIIISTKFHSYEAAVGLSHHKLLLRIHCEQVEHCKFMHGETIQATDGETVKLYIDGFAAAKDSPLLYIDGERCGEDDTCKCATCAVCLCNR